MLVLTYQSESVILPSPVFSDTVREGYTLSLKRAMDSTRYTGYKSTNRKTYVLTVELTRKKFTELETFYNKYCSKTMKLELHTGEQILGVITTNPLSGVMVAKRSGFDVLLNEELVNVTFEFEGVKQ